MLIRRIFTIIAACVALISAAQAQGVAGPYLAAQNAFDTRDYAAASRYLTRALTRDPQNAYLRSIAVQSFISIGDIDTADVVGQPLRRRGDGVPMARLVGVATAAQDGAFETALDILAGAQVGGKAMDQLLAAWAHMGLGQVRVALEKFDDVARDDGVRAFALYQKALATALVGDFEAALAVFEGDGGPPLPLTERAAMAKAQVMVQLDQRLQAEQMLRDRFAGTDNAAGLALADRIAAGAQVDFTVITSAREGMGEVLYTVALALADGAEPDFLLIYARIAHYLAPGNISALLLAAEYLEDLGNPSLATAAYDAVPRSHPAFLRAELGRAETLETSGRAEAAVEVLTQLAESYPNMRRVQMALGDLLRRVEDYATAQQVYDRVITAIDTPSQGDWFVYFARGVTHERLDLWPAAEADFRASLALFPDQPMVLNYLGYSFVDRDENLEEARDLIERAVAAAPDRGYIIDSLGWVLYRLGAFEEAVGHLERAIELMPTDPVVNDHLGDAYWQVGRKTEARFQWRRAASFAPEPEVAARIARKLDIGLDAVLRDEAAAPTQVSQDAE